MRTNPVSYRVLYHGEGQIKLEVPLLKKLSWTFLYNSFKNSPFYPLPLGINNIRVNPLTGNMIIKYEPDNINILDYIKGMASDPNIKKMIDSKQ
jgi:hypothetical protein